MSSTVCRQNHFTHTHTQASHSPRLIIPDSLNAQFRCCSFHESLFGRPHILLFLGKHCVVLGWRPGWQKTTVKRNFFEKKKKKVLPLQDFMESCFPSQRVVSICFPFPFNLVILLISICKHNKNRISRPASVIRRYM